MGGTIRQKISEGQAMKNLIKRRHRAFPAVSMGAVALLILAATAAVPPAVLADDTDVFFPTVTSSNQGVIRPNILFVIDTSGSMGAYDGYSQTRLQRVQDAFKQIMDGLNPNVNVGLARFSDTQGGPIMFPVAGVDEFVENVDLSGDGGNRTLAATIQDYESEASQKWDGSVSIAPSTLTVSDNFGLTSGSFTTLASRTAGEIAEQWSSSSGGNDGSGSRVNGGPNRCADSITVVQDNVSRGGTGAANQCYNNLFGSSSSYVPGTQTTGVRFTGLNLPAGATITSAYLTFELVAPSGTDPSDNGNNSRRFTITGERSSASAAFQGGASVPAANRPTGRTPTSTSVDWAIGSTNGNASATSPDIGSIVQEIFSKHNADGVSSVNALTFILSTGNSNSMRRSICGFTYQTSNSATSVVTNSRCSNVDTVPRLTINYSTPGLITTNSKMIGLRFGTVQVPKGVVLTSAKIRFRADNPVSQPNQTIRVAVENVDSANTYVSVANNVSSRSYSAATVDWVNPPFNVYQDDYETPELKDLINPILQRSGWCGGNAIAFKFEHLSGFATSRNAIGFSQDPNLAPTLQLAFSPSDPALETGCNKTTLASQISSPTTDDSFQINNNDSNFPACNVLYLGSTPSSAPISGCGASSQTNRTTFTGLRFNNINIPQGATVLEAFIDFTGHVNNETSSASFTFAGEATSNPVTFSSTTNHIGGRRSTPGLTSATVQWSASTTPPLARWDANGKYTSPNLASIVQEIVNRSDWAPNKSIAFHIAPTSASDTTGKRTAKSVNGSSAGAPKLRILIAGAAGKQTVRQALKEVVDAFSPVGFTPTMGALYEAARYYRGEEAFYGRTRGAAHSIESGEPPSNAESMAINGRAVYDYTAGTPERVFPPGCSDFNLKSNACEREQWIGTTRYKSPIQDACQSNNIILLSDGEPNNGGKLSGGSPSRSAEQLIGELIGNNSCVGTATNSSSNTHRTNCGTNLADFLRNQDQIPESKIFGKQTVTTYTIAFGGDVSSPTSLGGTFLRQVAEAGGGEFFTAESTEDVANAFNAIISAILDKGTTFVAPAVTINTFNRLTHRNELYFALFEPSSGKRWKGNLKRYQLLQNPGDPTPLIYDGKSTPQVAIDQATGFFKDTAQSFWSSTPDGDSVEFGGAASKLPAGYPVYSYLGSTAPSNYNVTAGAQVIESNSAVTEAMLGIPGPSDSDVPATQRVNVLKWARGIDVLDEDGDGDRTDPRARMNDPLHSEPLIISYLPDKNATPATAKEALQDDPLIQIYYGTNDGLLRALNADDGTQPWAFIPRLLLPNLQAYYENEGTYKTRPYGMDGPMTAYVLDGNANGFIVQSKTNSTPDTYTVKINGTTPATRNDFAYMYAGLRRGGRAYYAFDVTNRNNPILKFQLDNTTPGMAELGESWSRVIGMNVRVGNTNYPDDVNKAKASSIQKKRALIFAGGYDPGQDVKQSLYGSTGTAVADSQGRALFVVDSDNGQILWTASASTSSPTGVPTGTPHLSLPAMQFSIPAAPRAIDLDGDSFVDRIYFADMGGQVFRIILGKDSSGKASLSNATGGVIARLARFDAKTGEPTVDTGKHARRFFGIPSVALIDAKGQAPFVAISIGSGHRETPLSTAIEDRFYVLRDPDITNDAGLSGSLLNLSSTPYINGDADLIDVTNNIDPTNIKASFASGKKGFYIRLVSTTNELKGEKVVTEATVFNSQVFFATFTPSAEPSTGDNICKAAQGTSRFYLMSVVDGTPTQNFHNPSDTSSPLTVADRYLTLNQAGLPPDPTLLFPSVSVTTGTDGTQTPCVGAKCGVDNPPIICVGAECFSPGEAGRAAFKTYWRKVEK
jgi:type IV pilus assembly protein PilY1